jgi:hypothetical protein
MDEEMNSNWSWFFGFALSICDLGIDRVVYYIKETCGDKELYGMDISKTY